MSPPSSFILGDGLEDPTRLRPRIKTLTSTNLNQRDVDENTWKMKKPESQASKLDRPTLKYQRVILGVKLSLYDVSSTSLDTSAKVSNKLDQLNKLEDL